MKFWAIVGVFFLVLVAASAHGAENKRVALVIGNSKYEHALSLANPVEDARLMSATLRHSGFEVIDGFDLGYAGMHDAINRFAESSYEAEVALVFYAGHGMQVNGTNYLLPTDAELTSPAHLKTRTVQIDDLLAALPPDPAVGIVILDACRDNPLSRTLAAFFPKSRSGSVIGLAPVDVKPAETGTGGILIAYATDPGQVAFDGKGANSPYTSALVKHLAVPGLEIQSALTRVRGDVAASTGGRQRPWHNASLGREVFVGGEVAKAPAAPAVAASNAPQREPESGPSVWDVEQRIWDEASKRNTVAHYEAYLQRFPDGLFASIARLNIDQLKEPRNPSIAAVEAPRSTGEPVPTKTPPPIEADTGTELTEAAIGLTRDDRIDLQLRLEALGYELGAIDGVFGRGTRKAIGQWQAANGLPGTTFLTGGQRNQLAEETEPLIDAMRARHEAEKAKANAARAAEPSKAVKRAEPSKPVKRVDRANERRKSVRQSKAETRPAARPQKQKRFKRCVNVWGVLEVPVDQPCRAGVDTQYQNP